MAAANAAEWAWVATTAAATTVAARLLVVLLPVPLRLVPLLLLAVVLNRAVPLLLLAAIAAARSIAACSTTSSAATAVARATVTRVAARAAATTVVVHLLVALRLVPLPLLAAWPLLLPRAVSNLRAVPVFPPAVLKVAKPCLRLLATTPYPMPVVDPSAFIPTQRRVVQASTSLVR